MNSESTTRRLGQLPSKSSDSSLPQSPPEPPPKSPQRSNSQFRTFGAPIQTPFSWLLPSKVISRILHFIHQDIDDAAFLDLPSGSKRYREMPSIRQAPLNVSQVSRAWRQAALASPHLWSRIVARDKIAVPSGFCKRRRFKKAWHATIEEQLKRSQSHPLDVVWVLTDENKQAFKSVLREAHRWRSLCIVADSRSLFKRMPAALESAANRIERLLISVDEDARPKQRPFIDIARFPKLRMFSEGPIIPGIVPSSLFHPPTAPCQNIRTLKLTQHLSWTEVLQCFDSLPSLVDFSCEVTGNAYPAEPDEIRLLPNLSTLAIGFHHSERGFSGQEFCFLEAPVLESLIITSTADAASDHLQDHLTSFVKRSAFSLRNLALRGPLFTSAEAMLEVLKSVPSIYLLLLSSREDLCEGLLRGLGARERLQDGTTRPYYVPKLSNLAVYSRKRHVCSTEDLLSVIALRWMGADSNDSGYPMGDRRGRHLKELRLSPNLIPNGFSEHPVVMKAVADGLKLELRRGADD